MDKIKDRNLQEDLNCMSDRELISLLYGRIRDLEVEIQNIKLRYDDIPYTSSHILFILSIIGFLIVFGLTISPYLGQMKFEVPKLISYICAFANVIFAYFAHSTYKTLRFNRSFRRNTKYGLDQLKSDLTNAKTVYETAQAEMEVAK